MKGVELTCQGAGQCSTTWNTIQMPTMQTPPGFEAFLGCIQWSYFGSSQVSQVEDVNFPFHFLICRCATPPTPQNHLQKNIKIQHVLSFLATVYDALQHYMHSCAGRSAWTVLQNFQNKTCVLFLRRLKQKFPLSFSVGVDRWGKCVRLCGVQL